MSEQCISIQSLLMQIFSARKALDHQADLLEVRKQDWSLHGHGMTTAFVSYLSDPDW